MAITTEIIDAIDDLEKSYQEARQNAKELLIKAFQDFEAENKRLRETLAQYGSHKKGCTGTRFYKDKTGEIVGEQHCFCGFEQALKGEKCQRRQQDENG